MQVEGTLFISLERIKSVQDHEIAVGVKFVKCSRHVITC